ncbi:poly-gamma-glutamate synthase PgsB [Alkalihalophilus marmarensis]|uniref:poly-gamma-glutamate synthase PgsB n=1 Tax=Alkalihalophilus marmarensis TaxID=521377 RepID=UPI002DB9A07A|nr:poly-gamma-glutamate synthase PgsB [Alkalihalophilus marmarensis]MEC2073428.1 poly-gamma-glutamate synthase PgsB [Alkalihalophilus marmarensis]
MAFIPISIFVIFILVLGIREKIIHKRNIDSIPVRVNINGIRGKSTVTRLVTGVITETGKRTIGKTTGTSARMIYWNKKEEKPIKRRLEGPNIREQRIVVKEAADLDAEVLVSECMAVNPDYQITFQEEMVQANIGVIVNVLEDHMDVMGPTLDEVAQAFVATIPYNGHLIVTESPYTDYYKEIAEKRNTKVIVADNSRISEAFLKQFEYMVFPENASLALAVAEALGIDEETAFRGMLNAHPDPGAMRIIPMDDHSNQTSYFVNGFAANDAASTINIWKRVELLGYPTKHPVIIMNCREDRVERTEQFARDVLPHIEMDKLVVIGESVSPIVDAFEDGLIPANEIVNFEGASTDEIADYLYDVMASTTIYGVGNIHGAAEPLIEKLNQFKVKRLAS